MRQVKYQEGYYTLDTARWFRTWNSPRNPFGNWHEPMPWPEKRRVQAPANQWLAWLWWQFWRNPLHNFSHFWIGITPVGRRYEWITPDEDGWIRFDGCWVKGHSFRCSKAVGLWGGRYLFVGYRRRGNLQVSLEKPDE